MIAEAGRLGTVRQALVNPSDECLWNLLSACSNTGAALRCAVLQAMHVMCPAAPQCQQLSRTLRMSAGAQAASPKQRLPLKLPPHAADGSELELLCCDLQATWRCWRCC